MASIQIQRETTTTRQTRDRLWSAAWTIVCQASDIGAQTIAAVLVARLLGPHDMGVFGVAMATAGIAALFTLFGTSDVAIRMYATKQRCPRAVFGASLTVLGFGTAISTGCALFIASVLVEDSIQVAAIAIALATLAANALGSVLNQAIIGLGASKKDLPGLAGTRWLLVVGVWCGATFAGLLPAMAAYLGASVLLAVWRTYLVVRLLGGGPRWRADVARDLWREGKSVGLGSVAAALSSRSDVILLSALAGPVQAGLYVASLRALGAVTACSSAIAVALFPGLASELATRKSRTHIMLYVLGPIAFLVVTLTAAFGGAGQILEFVYGPEYAEASTALMFLLVAGGLTAAVIFASKFAIATERAHILPRAQAAGAITNIGLNLALIPTFAATGAAVATAIAAAVTLVSIGLRLRPANTLTTKEIS